MLGKRGSNSLAGELPVRSAVADVTVAVPVGATALQLRIWGFSAVPWHRVFPDRTSAILVTAGIGCYNNRRSTYRIG